MQFNSFSFIYFFFIVVSLYFLINKKYRWGLLLAASYYFYISWNPAYILLIIGSTLVDYFCSKKMMQNEVKEKRKTYLYISLGFNLLLLFFFKYINFLLESIHGISSAVSINYEYNALSIILPVGISFYTFQTLSYTIDVYNGKIKAENHFGYFALFVSFFPQLVAGPIERSDRLLPQLKQTYNFNYERVRNGILLMIWGFFKKIVVADRLAEYVNEVFNNPGVYSGINTIIASIFFCFQLYCDFSAYSDIAIGTALVLGVKLMTNFRQPYFSLSISEFWSRWHISLSTWFRDYLYIPLGGNRVVKWRWYYNLFIVFLVSGLWHGANWTFVVWGAFHGIALVIENMFIQNFGKNALPKWTAPLKLIVTFALVTFGFMIFRANSMPDVGLHIKSLFSSLSYQPIYTNNELIISLYALAILLVVDLIDSKIGLKNFYFNHVPKLLRWIMLIAILLNIVFLGKFVEEEFLYFQF